MGIFGGIKRQVKGRYHRAKAINRGRKVMGISLPKYLGYKVSDAREQRKANKAYKKQHGKAAYKTAKKQGKADERYYRKHQWGF